MRGSPPLRFLAIVLGGWAVLRTALIAPPWSAPPADAAAAAPDRARLALQGSREARPALHVEGAVARERAAFPAAGRLAGHPVGRRHPTSSAPRLMTAPSLNGTVVATAVPPPLRPQVGTPPWHGPGPVSTGRWSLSAWTFVRQGDAPPLAAGGLLDGSQAGARLAYRLNRDSARPLALSARLSAPLRRTAGAEAALGVSWKPSGRLPVHLLAERRQALGREGRSAFAVTFYGGVSDAPLGPFRIDAYAQAGIVGARSRDPFGDGSLRLSLPLGGRARLGAGAWAAAQPGLSRLDLGPQAALRLPVAGRSVTLAADWRIRVAGNARPDSGPTLTLGTDF